MAPGEDPSEDQGDSTYQYTLRTHTFMVDVYTKRKWSHKRLVDQLRKELKEEQESGLLGCYFEGEVE